MVSHALACKAGLMINVALTYVVMPWHAMLERPVPDVAMALSGEGP